MITRRTIVISLAVSFLLQWSLSLLLWIGLSHARAMVIWLAPLAPPYYGVRFLIERDLDVAFASLIVTVLAIVLCLLAVLKRRIATLIPAHIMLVVYWFWSYCLIGIGV